MQLRYIFQARKQYGFYSQPKISAPTARSWLTEYLCSVRTLYPNSTVINLTGDPVPENPEENDCDNSRLHAFVHLWCSIRTEKVILHLFEYNTFSLSSATRYSPAFFGENQTRLLFIAYQIVSIFKTFQDLNLFVGEVRLKDFMIMKTLHIKLVPKLSEFLILELNENTQTKEEEVSQNEPETEKPFCDIVEDWSQGRISNLDYILHLNRKET